MTKRLTQEEKEEKRKQRKNKFIKNAQKKHNDKYDYSLSRFKNMTTKITIICPTHGNFKQSPQKHKSGQGCPKCKGKNMTTEDWILKAKRIHGDKFDYSKVNYINQKTKVEIICSKHGSFLQIPKNHLRGRGCLKCAKNCQRYTKEDFVKKAIEKHGNKFDYSKFRYINSDASGIIICPEHGEFQQTPYTHLHSIHGCGKCSGNIKKPKKEFIKQAREIHGDKYDYSKFNYINAKTPGTIICPIHGPFQQQPYVHTGQKCGCPKCGREMTEKAQRHTKEDFVKKAIEKHGNKFDYSKFRYINSDTSGIIICPEHGEFQQTPYQHLKTKHGCGKCSGNTKKTKEEFIREASLIHDNKFDYSEIGELNGMHSYIIIGCPKHGEFRQTADSHLNGKTGCPKCSCNGTSKIEKELVEFVLITKPNLQHYNSKLGQFKIPNTNYRADGYDPDTNTIYEMLGDYWHGNPKIYPPGYINKTCNKTAGELYQTEMKRKKICESKDFKYVQIWENDWKRGIDTISRIQKIFRNSKKY
jgi:hypothetical protein